MARILIIEDTPANLELMSYLLEAHGHAVLEHPTGQGAVERVAAERPDLVVCDLQLPVEDGFAIARRIKADAGLCRIPLLAVTALAMVGDREKAHQAGFDGYVSKPIDPERFVPEVEALLPTALRSGRTDLVHERRPDAPGTVPRRGTTLLVVDNLAVHLELARSLFEPQGHEVLTAGCIAEAMQALQDRRVDLILSDVCMGPDDGRDLLRLVRAESRLADVPFVFVTSSMPQASDAAEALALGATLYLTRPIEPTDLVRAIESCLPPAGEA